MREGDMLTCVAILLALVTIPLFLCHHVEKGTKACSVLEYASI
jgi:hypothetical protein